MWQALAEGCWSVTGVSFVSAVKGMKILPDVIPKNKNGVYWPYVILTGLFTSLLPTDAVFTQLSNYRHSLFHVRSEGNFFTDLSITIYKGYWAILVWCLLVQEVCFCGIQTSNQLCLFPVSDMFICKTGTTQTLRDAW